MSVGEELTKWVEDSGVITLGCIKQASQLHYLGISMDELFHELSNHKDKQRLTRLIEESEEISEDLSMKSYSGMDKVTNGINEIKRDINSGNYAEAGDKLLELSAGLLALENFQAVKCSRGGGI